MWWRRCTSPVVDSIAVPGVGLLAAGPLGAEPLLVQVGYTRFALRRAEAARVVIKAGRSGLDAGVPA